VLVANEGEPSDYCAPSLESDPVGSISIIDVDLEALERGNPIVRTVGFDDLDAARVDPQVRVTGPKASLAQDIEPEYIAVSGDSRTAYVSLQENNAIAELDVEAARVVRLIPLGLKDHARVGEGLDPSDRDGELHPGRWPVAGLYQPDAIALYETSGERYLVTANEGDPRTTYGCFDEQVRVAELGLDPEVFADPSLVEESRLGRLHVARDGDTDGDGLLERLHAFGARSFSVWSVDGERLYDSGEEFEQHLAEAVPSSLQSQALLDAWSDDRGPEPDGLVIGQVGQRSYAFVGLERAWGVMVYDISEPRAPRFVSYLPTLEHVPTQADVSSVAPGEELGPEGLLLIAAADSPTGEALLVLANEGGSVALFAVVESLPFH
jgi:hypothetical protein